MALLERHVKMVAGEQGRQEIPGMVKAAENYGHNLAGELCDGWHGIRGCGVVPGVDGSVEGQ